MGEPASILLERTAELVRERNRIDAELACTVRRADQAQCCPSRTQPPAEGDRALEVPERFIELPGTCERLAHVVQRRSLQAGRA